MPFEFIMTPKEIREIIFNYLKPEYKSSFGDKAGKINWTTGVYNREAGIFLTKINTIRESIARETVNCDRYTYIVITMNGDIYTIDHGDEYNFVSNNMIRPQGQYASLDLLQEGIEKYQELYNYRKSLNSEEDKMLKAISEEMDDRCHKNYPINCEEDAGELFKLNDCITKSIYDLYNKKTINDFKKFATDENILRWRESYYLHLLNMAMNFALSENERLWKFRYACHSFWRGVNSAHDEIFLKAVKSLCLAGNINKHLEISLNSYLATYMEKYSDNLQNIVPLIKFLKVRIKENTPMMNKLKKIENEIIKNNSQ